MKILDVIKSLLPEGTEQYKLLMAQAASGELLKIAGSGSGAGWDQCPSWPPDLFAVVGSIIDRSSCYTFAGPNLDMLEEHRGYLAEVFSTAKSWDSYANVPAPIQNLWTQLIGIAAFTEIKDVCANEAVRSILLKLFAIADEACDGIGWSVPAEGSDIKSLAYVSFFDRALLAQEYPDATVLPYAPVSVCSLVPTDLAIVLPKSMTANVGCTIRSLSHHLALLPGSTQVEPTWVIADRPEISSDFVRILLVPFPFNIPDTSFSLKHDKQEINKHASTPGFFGLRQDWLRAGQGEEEITAESFVEDLLLPLLKSAKKEAGNAEIQGIVMPECALSAKLADEVAERLKNSEVGIEFFITGVLTKNAINEDRNMARSYFFASFNGEVGVISKEQSKHHRWRIDETQARRYALNFPDSSKISEEARRSKQWWESIDVSRRTLPFFAIRKDISLSVLICEDLARADPAMSVIRAVGPNMVFALLMDGPQLATRWPGRYATVLADDPGSSVLTLSCIGMVDRSNWMESRPVRSIGLWRDSGGRTQELNLPDGHHGMLLTLKSKAITQNTLDNRSDLMRTKKLSLVTTVPLKIAHGPDWL